jgi:spermidine synthase
MPKEKIQAGGVFTVQCVDKDGNVKWTAEKHNLVVNVGLKDMNDKYFTGSSYTAAWYIGLYGSASTNNPAASDTMSSHAGWTEVTDYSQSNRPTATFAAATTADPSVITNSASPATFSMNATTTVGARS